MSPDFAAHEIAATAEFIPAKVNQYSKNFRKEGKAIFGAIGLLPGRTARLRRVFNVKKLCRQKNAKKALSEEARRIKAKKGHVFRRCKKGASLFRALFQTIGSNVIYAPA